ncbi:MAG: DUF4236 domain-containing protein [Fimbriimonadales bacterium]|nr:DUF4236 domain-containing protein [Fimbriimonadales bacterium]
MGFRFFRRFQILPGVTINWSKSGPSISLGPKGAKLTFGTTGVRATVGLPGTGLFYTQKISGGSDGRSASGSRRGDQPNSASPYAASAAPEDRALLQACMALQAQDAAEALRVARLWKGMPDACFLGGLAALALQQAQDALELLGRAVARPGQLGDGLRRLGVEVAVRVEIAEGVLAVLRPEPVGAFLALAEAAQLAGRFSDAIGYAERVLALLPEDPVARLSLAELLMVGNPESPSAWRRVLELTADAAGSAPVRAALALYRARALRRLGRAREAIEASSGALRSPTVKPQELLLELRLERAKSLLEVGDRRRARVDLRRIFEQDPCFAGVAEMLRKL